MTNNSAVLVVLRLGVRGRDLHLVVIVIAPSPGRELQQLRRHLVRLVHVVLDREKVAGPQLINGDDAGLQTHGPLDVVRQEGDLDLLVGDTRGDDGRVEVNSRPVSPPERNTNKDQTDGRKLRVYIFLQTLEYFLSRDLRRITGEAKFYLAKTFLLTAYFSSTELPLVVGVAGALSSFSVTGPTPDLF